MKHLGMSIDGCRVIIQGFGNVGSNAAKLLAEKGYTIIGIAEYDGGLYNTERHRHPRAHRAPQARRHHHRLHRSRGRRQERAPHLQLRHPHPRSHRKRHHQPERRPHPLQILCEGANGPTTTVADEILADKGVFIIPDILANAGGVTTSYFEWVQDRMGYFWTEAEVNQRLDNIMTESFHDVVTYADTHNVNNRIAAYMLAIDRVAYTTKQRGIYA